VDNQCDRAGSSRAPPINGSQCLNGGELQWARYYEDQVIGTLADAAGHSKPAVGTVPMQIFGGFVLGKFCVRVDLLLSGYLGTRARVQASGELATPRGMFEKDPAAIEATGEVRRVRGDTASERGARTNQRNLIRFDESSDPLSLIREGWAAVLDKRSWESPAWLCMGQSSCLSELFSRGTGWFLCRRPSRGSLRSSMQPSACRLIAATTVPLRLLQQSVATLALSASLSKQDPIAEARQASDVSPAAKRLRPLLAVVAVAGVSFALLRAPGNAAQASLTGTRNLLVAVSLSLTAVVVSGLAWAVLLGSKRIGDVLPGYFVAVFARYIPGTVWQGVSQVLDAIRLGSSAGFATSAYLVQMATQLVAATAVGLVVLISGVLHRNLGLLTVGLLAAALLSRPIWVWAIGLIGRIGPSRISADAALLPNQRSIVVATAFALIGVVAQGLAFWALLAGGAGKSFMSFEVVLAVSVFAAAWAVGFVAIPVPAGLGVREAILVVGLGQQFGAAPILAASIAHRMAGIFSELLAAGFVWTPLLLRRLRSR